MKQGNAPATIGDRLRQARQQRGLSQEALAERADLQFGSVGKIERGQFIPRTRTVQRLATALNVSPGWLMYGDDNEGSTP